MDKNIDLAEILEKVYGKIAKEITDAYYNGEIDYILEKYDLKDKISYSYYDFNNSKILIVGNSMISKDVMISIAKKYGIKENRLEFELDYDRLHNYNFGNLRNNMSYSDVLVGPLPHKVKGIEKYNSFLAMAEANPEEFPKIIRLEGSNELKITRQSFLDGLLKTRLYND